MRFRSLASLGPLSFALSFAPLSCAEPPEDAGVAEQPVQSPSTDPEYLVFDSHEDAAGFMEAFRPLFDASFGGSGAVVPPEDPRVERLRGLLAEHWAAIVPIFQPRIPQPHIVLFEAPIANAAVLFDPRIDKTANALYVTAAVLDLPDEEVGAILAHELGHLVLKNIDPAHEEERHYATSTPEVLGILQADDPAVRSVLEPWLRDASVYGAYPIVELRGVPTGATLLASYLLIGMSAASDPAKPACASLQQHVEALNAIVRLATYDDITMTATPEQLAQIAASAAGIEATAGACLEPAPGVSLADAIATRLADFGLTPELVRPVFGADLTVADAAPDHVTGMFAMIGAARGRMRAALAAHDFETFRRYTSEEQADDFAMTILHAQGKDPTSMGRGVLAAFPAPVRTACEATLAVGEMPTYGLLDPHHSPCYRAYHSQAFAAHLASGGAGVQPSAVPGTRASNARAFDPARDRVLND